MKKIKMKRFMSFAFTVVLLFAYVTGIGLQTQAAEETSQFGVTDEELNEARRQFFGDSEFNSFSVEPEVVYINDSNIIHKPQEYKYPEQSDFGIASYSAVYGGSYNINDTRLFSNSAATSFVQGKLIAQGSHVNIWVLDNADFHKKTSTTCNNYCHLLDIDATLGNEIAATFDPIYEAMTDSLTGFAAYEKVKIQTGYSNMPVVGDIGDDGKVNFLLYDLYGDGGSESGYTAGFFDNGDFFISSESGNELDMLHIDIGEKQGYEVLKGNDSEAKLDFYATMAHEFQHLLFYMYYGVYTPGTGYDSDDWMNETLAELAGAFYTDTSKELVSDSIITSAAQNTYSYGGYKNEYYDFLNHGSLKNYAMERLFAHVLHKKYPNIASKIYSHIKTTYPPAKNYTELTRNTANIKSMMQATGDFLKAGTSIGTGGENSFALMYYIFMESFAADGGTVYTTASDQSTIKPFTPTNPLNNLWAVRPVAGVANGALYLDMSTAPYGSYYPTDNYDKIPPLASGGSISLKGYGPSNGKGATHEMLYKLTGGSESTPYLTITAPNDGNNTTRYYAAIPQDELFTGPPTYTSGESGASVYMLEKGVPIQIDTQGQEAYLFVVTLYKNVTSSVAYSWSDELQDVDITKAFKDENFLKAVREVIKKPTGAIYKSDVEDITDLDVSNKGIESLAGIEHFTALTWLVCVNNQLEELDVSKNIILRGLDCHGNQLKALDVSANSALIMLSCSFNQLTALDVLTNSALTSLYCYGNNLTTLDLSANNALTSLHCNNNKLAALDVSNNTELTWLRCDNNKLAALDVSNNTDLIELYCHNNRLTALDVTKNTMLKALECYQNHMTSFDDVVGWNEIGLILDETFTFYSQKEYKDIILEDLFEEADDNYEIVSDNGIDYIKGVEIGNIASLGLSNDVKVYKEGSTTPLASTEKITTGMIIKKDGKEIIIVIKGDMTGNGAPDIEDAKAFLEHLVGNQTLPGAYAKAADDFIEDSAIKSLRTFLNFLMADN